MKIAAKILNIALTLIDTMKTINLEPSQENLDIALNEYKGIGNTDVEVLLTEGDANTQIHIGIRNGVVVNSGLHPLVVDILMSTFPTLKFAHYERPVILRGQEAVSRILDGSLGTDPYLCFVDPSYNNREEGQIIILNPNAKVFWDILGNQRNVALYLFHSASGYMYPVTFKDGECTSPHNTETKQFVSNHITPLFGAKWDLAA